MFKSSEALHTQANKIMFLFGGDKQWNSAEWTASDDRVRGGSSQSYLDISESGAVFHGNLDTKTLGGAGFASQRTIGDDKEWDLSNFDGIALDVAVVDAKRYTFVLKDEILPKDPKTGREQSTISYEFDFAFGSPKATNKGATLFIPWSSLNPTYRGRDKKDAGPLNTKSIKRISILMRSFFGDQEGEFSCTLRYIAAVKLSEDVEPPKAMTLHGGNADNLEKGVFSRNPFSRSHDVTVPWGPLSTQGGLFRVVVLVSMTALAAWFCYNRLSRTR